MGVELAIQAIIMVASVLYQRQQQKKAKKEAMDNRGFMVPTRGESENIPVVYGKQAIGGIETRHKTSRTYNASSNNANKQIIEDLPNNTWSASDNEFLYVQSVLCQGDIKGVEYVYVDDKPYGTKDSKFHHRINIHNQGGTADAMATANDFPSSERFTGCAHATSVYRFRSKEPGYSGVPTPMYMVKGRKIRGISGSLNVTGEVYSNNPALVLLDYLTNTQYGRGLSLDEIDLFSFYRSSQICATTVTSNRRIGGRINGVKPILTFANFQQFPNEGSEESLYKADDTNIYYRWRDDEEDYIPTDVPTRNIPLYECNLTLDTGDKIRDNIELILNTMGLAELVWGSDGKYRLLLEYPSGQSALNSLVATNSNFDDDDIVRETVSVSYLSANERLNQATVSFMNEHEDFKQDSMTWPETGSSVHNQFMTEDNQQPFTTSANSTGITDPYHALAKAEQMVRQGRELKNISFTVSKKAIGLEPGDFFKINSEILDIDNEIYRVNSVTVNADLTIVITGYLFTINMLAWNIDDDIAYAERPVYDFTVDPVTNLRVDMGFFTNNDGTIMNYMDVSWDHPGSYQFEIKYKKQSEPVSSYRSIITRLLTYRIFGIEPDTLYDVLVSAVSSYGSPSEESYVQGENAGKFTPPGTPTDFTANGIFEAVQLDWTNPADRDLRTIQVWESANDSIGNATLIAVTPASNFHRGNLGISQQRWYWVRAEDTSGNFSGYAGPVTATTTFIDDEAYENGIRALFEDQGLYPIEDVDGLPTEGGVGQQVFNTEDGKLYRYTGTEWVLVIAAVEAQDIDGQLVSTQIGNNSISSDKIIANSIQGGDIKANTITGGLMAASGIITNTAQINNSLITNAKISNAAITTAKIVDGNITNAKIGNTIQSTNFRSGSTGWRILKTGAAEFNGVVISRQMRVWSGSAYLGDVGEHSKTWTQRQDNNEQYTWAVETSLTHSGWGAAQYTYVANVGATGSVNGYNGTMSDVKWGFSAQVVPLTRFSGNQRLWVIITPYLSRVAYTNLTAQIYVYRVT